jgi:hypothetical protein
MVLEDKGHPSQRLLTVGNKGSDVQGGKVADVVLQDYEGQVNDAAARRKGD